MPKKIQAFFIDFQGSFCNVVDPAQQQILHDGELCVPGGLDDARRAAKLIHKLGDRIDELSFTLDSHSIIHIAHPTWWRHTTTGEMPPPFTIITENPAQAGTFIGTAAIGNVPLGEFRTVKQGLHARTLAYIRALEATGRYPHCIWPPHCLIASRGYDLVPEVLDAMIAWEGKTVKGAQKVTKGSNPWTEHFGAVRAEVPDPQDPFSNLNTDFIDSLDRADEILIGGEARSHCVANTVRDVADTFQDDSFIKKCVLLTDCTSDVPGFEAVGQKFVQDMVARGMRTTTSVDYAA